MFVYYTILTRDYRGFILVTLNHQENAVGQLQKIKN